MSGGTKKGPIIDPGVCRGCGASKKCRLLNVEYEWLGQKEVYADMFVDTFGLLLSQLDGEESQRLICATCVLRLRDASAFRRQVLQCEELLLQTWMCDVPAVTSEIKEEYNIAPSDGNVFNNGNIFNSAKMVNNANVVDNDKIVNDANIDNANVYSDNIVNCDDNMDYDEDKSHNSVADGDNESDNIVLSKVLIKDELVTLSTAVKKEKKPKTKKIKKRRSKERRMIEDMMEIDAKQIDTIERRQEMRQKMELNKRSLENTVIIVENSYVCPFDTSFSDYYCFYCRDVITDPDKLRDHTLTHDPATFKDIIANIYSKKTLQIDITRIDCRMCTQNISDVENFKTHISEAHGKTIHPIQNEFLKFKLTANNLSCIECGSVFAFFHALKKHMAEHFGSCICDVCGAHYFDERMLVLHKKSHEKIDENFPCGECGKVFKSHQSRLMHENKIHRKEPTYECPKCEMMFFSYNLRYRHLIESHGEQRLFRCDHCDKAYDSRKSLREHNRRVHARTFLHQCDLCDKRFYLPSRLREHMSTHTGERNFRCEYCGKSYPRLRGLKVHMQSHSRDKRYKCTMCSASFTQNANLKNHVRKQHQTAEEGLEGSRDFSSSSRICS